MILCKSTDTNNSPQKHNDRKQFSSAVQDGLWLAAGQQIQQDNKQLGHI